MKLFQNKFFIICLAIAVILCAVPTTLSLMGYRSLSKNIVGTVTLPLRFVISSIGNGIDGFGRYFQSVEGVHERNEMLESELNELKQRLEEAEILEAENKRLRAYLGMKEKYPSYDKKRCFITHSSADKEIVDAVKEKVQDLFEFDEVIETVAGSIITSHCGKNTIGVLFVYNK